MKKVLNWTIGSFFRTIGRILAFFIIGIAVAYVLARSDLNISNIFRYTLGVHASTYGYVYSDNVQWSLGNGYWNNPTYGNGYWSFNDSANSSQELYYFRFTQVSLPSNANSINVNIRFNVTSWEDQQITTNSPFTCTVNSHSEWLNIGDSSSPMQDDYEFEIDNFVCQSYNTTTKTYNNDFGLSLYYVSNSGISDYFPCYAVSSAGNVYNFSCPIQSNNISGYRLVVNANSDLDYTISMSNLSVFDTDTTQQIIQQQQQTTQAITNQTQQDQQQHEEMMDSNTTQAEDDAQDFFESFDAPDIGGLSAIITAPLSTIQSLLNATCTNLVLPLPFVNQNLTLPCMNDIYTEHFGAFFTLYQTIILGIIAYRCIRSIFFDLQGFANPSDDRIEVMDL